MFLLVSTTYISLVICSYYLCLFLVKFCLRMASSSQRVSASLPSTVPSAPRWKYDVFLSFKGEDVRKTFLSHLYHELQKTRRIFTFKDDKELAVGESISPSLLKAIEESRFSIIVLSPNYAYSPWCLEELTKIVDCMEDENRILPLFYHVEPSDVRHQKNSFEVAFTKHEATKRHDRETVKRWRDALKTVANFSGWHTNNFKTERELVEAVVESVCNKVRPIQMSTGDFEAFEATRQAMDEVMKALKNNEVAAIGVYGMGGVGKTSMVKHVGAQAQNNGLFHQVIMAVVSQSPDLRKIQGSFADFLGLKFEEETEIGRAARLMEKITRGNKTLIILDDIWERIDLSSIGIPSYDELQKCNSKVLLTTRRLHVCHSMKTQPTILLNILSEEDSWNLFVKQTRKSFEKSTEFYDVGRKVARECAGLPVALRAVATALGDKDFEDWKEAARKLEMSQRVNLDDKGDVFNCIKLSYDYLGSTDVKSFFLLCCLFPEDYDIQIEDLLKYGFGMGLFRDVSTIANARIKTSLVTKYLIASCLLLDGANDGCVRMHDVIRDMAMSIASSECGDGYFVKASCGLTDWPMDANERYSAISLMENHICKLPNELECSKLQILLLTGNVSIKEIPKTFFRSPNALTVLDLSKTSISLLPPSFNLITNLQALYLDYCESPIIDISILRKLKKLEILSMRGLLIEEFPKEIGQLTNLRMLDITDGIFDRVPSQVISRLHRLEELYMKCKFKDWGSQVEGGFYAFFFGKNAAFNELTGLSHLNKLEVYISGSEYLPKTIEFDPNWVSFHICINKEEGMIVGEILCGDRDRSRHHFRCLSLDTSINTLPDWFINVVTKKAENLSYTECKGINNIVMEHDHGRLHGLKSLVVYDDSDNKNLKQLFNTTKRVSNEPVFQSLLELHIEVMSGLKELCVGELPAGSLCNLKLLKIKRCRDLVNTLLPSQLLRRLQNLELLTCANTQTEYVFGSEGLESEHIILTKLTRMELDVLEELISVWKGPAPHAIFRNLTSLKVYGCKKLRNLFTIDVAQCLLQLEVLYLKKCHSLDRVIEASEEMVNNKKIVFPELKYLILKDLPQLTRFCSSPTSLDSECPSLEHSYVHDCPHFSIPASSDFNSGNHVQINNKQHWSSLCRRLGLTWLDRQMAKSKKKQ